MWYKGKELKERRAEHAERAEVEANQILKLKRVTKSNKIRQVINSAVALKRVATRSVTSCIFIINIF